MNLEKRVLSSCQSGEVATVRSTGNIVQQPLPDSHLERKRTSGAVNCVRTFNKRGRTNDRLFAQSMTRPLLQRGASRS